MSRRRKQKRREIKPDSLYNSKLVARFINSVMKTGKKTTATKVVYGMLAKLREATKKDPLEVFDKALYNVKPRLEVRPRRMGGATYQIPMEVDDHRKTSLAIRWVLKSARSRSGHSMVDKLTAELLDAYNNKGNAIKKREEVHKMAEANKAFAHFRW